MNIELTEKEFRRLLDMVYIGNWILNSTRGDDRFEDYDELQEKLFTLCLDRGMRSLVQTWHGRIYPSKAYEDGGIHEAIADYEDAVFYNILAEELARRDLGLEDRDPEDFAELPERMEDYLDEFEKNGLNEKVWQYFIAVPDIKSVGVKDESRYEGWPAIIRAVNTTDAMTATIEEVPYSILHQITYRITHEVEGINRVLLDLTPKPIGTIEWE